MAEDLRFIKHLLCEMQWLYDSKGQNRKIAQTHYLHTHSGGEEGDCSTRKPPVLLLIIVPRPQGELPPMFLSRHSFNRPSSCRRYVSYVGAFRVSLVP